MTSLATKMVDADPWVFDRDFRKNFDRFWVETEPYLFGSATAPSTIGEFLGVSPRLNVEHSEDDSKTVFSLDLPGHKRENIKIKIVDKLVTIEAKTGNRDFSQSFTLPTGFDLNGVTSRYQDGVLYLTIPKSQKKSVDIIVE